MQLKERLEQAIIHSSQFTDQLFSEIQSDEDWIRRSCENGNHAVWIAGHLAMATNFFIGLIEPSRKLDPGTWAKLFGKGSEPLDDLAAYPAPATLLEYLAERRKSFLELLASLSGEDLEREVPEGPPFMFDVGAVFQMSVWHESLHAGQLSVIHRLAGHSPLTSRNA